MRIRPATRAELPSILAIEQASETAPHWSEAVYLQAFETTARCLLVAEADAICGYAVGSLMGGEAELESVAVDREFRRHGVGRQLCAAVIDWARAGGARSITLEVRAGSAGAIALYRSLGFRPAGRRPGYYADPFDDALIQRLDNLQSD